MASLAFEQAFAHLKRQAARDANAPNGFGVTREILEAWRGKSVPVTALRKISEADAAHILEHLIWNEFQGDELPPSLAVMVMDVAVQTSVVSAVKLLQKSYNAAKPKGLLKADGVVGPRTINAVRSMDAGTLLNEVIVQRGAALAVRQTIRQFNLSWARRLLDSARLAYSFLGDKRARSSSTSVSEVSTGQAAMLDVRRHYFFHAGHGVTCYGSFFRLWDGWATAAHVMEDMLFINPPFAQGDQLHRPAGLDVCLIGCSLPAEEPPAPSKGQELVVAGYPWGARHVETRTCEALYEMDHTDLRFRNSVGTFWTARIYEPAEPVVRGMSGGVVYDAVSGIPMGILTTANHAADFDQDGDSDQSCDFVSLNRLWHAAKAKASRA